MTRLSANEQLLLRAAGPQAALMVAFEEALRAGRNERSETIRRQASALRGGLAALLRRIGEGVSRARTRRRVIDQLSRLDDRLLRDIGLERGTLDEAVDASLEKRAPAWALDGLADFGKAILAPLVRPVTRWRRDAATLGELSQLDDHLLADIGVSRGDLHFAPEAVLARCESPDRVANENRAPLRAA